MILLNLADVLLLSLGLAMDAFAVSICKGLATQKLNFKYALTVGLYFGVFQGIMPLIGYLLANSFIRYIERFDHWIAFILLAAIGISMIVEAIKGDEDKADDSLKVSTMLVLAVATSIDALAVGISMACAKMEIHILAAVAIIGVVTLVLCMAGVKIGNVFGAKFKRKSEIAGGVILILIGAKILLEHLGIL